MGIKLGRLLQVETRGVYAKVRAWGEDETVHVRVYVNGVNRGERTRYVQIEIPWKTVSEHLKGGEWEDAT